MKTTIRPIAIYLPQFHPIPENDKWWGKGFTEWTNVAKAKPLFDDHYQPHLPADLGFYDLRVPEVRQQQAQLAKEHGIYGFCYYHYWFNGRRILERPFQEVFESGKPDFPFMLCWANENWTRTWDGHDKEVLLQQHYSAEDDRAHIRALIPYFKDARYIKVDGKPVIAIYRSTLLPNPAATTAIWREEARQEGLELYICRFESFTHNGRTLVEQGGFDAGIDFQPFGNFSEAFQKQQRDQYFQEKNLPALKEKARRAAWRLFDKKRYNTFWENIWNVWDYEKYVSFVTKQSYPEDYTLFPGLTPGWDNSARRKKNYVLFKNASPGAYEKWLRAIVNRFKPRTKEENFVFVNAWNEWAEGNHLEPDAKWGMQYLEKTKRVLNNE